ncbi:hypothetical protein C0585_03475 [Candidatus Woesearchaeota archaeon]|mgnify:CR=1 FL=1|nr:MAG: hypothetical protein C0585_03475 [Candidatus Woesearchaeota archaeon]
MVRIELLDGTTDPKFGTALRMSFAEIAKYHPMEVSVAPGSTDYVGYNQVKNAEKGAFNSRRNQLHATRFLCNMIENDNGLYGINTMILTEQDIYDDGLNWAFGGVKSDAAGGKHLILSVARLNNLEALTHTGIHELGHIYGAAGDLRRSNTESNLGPHCTNFCVMEQKLDVQLMLEQSRRLSSKKDKFCYQCINDIMNYRGI